MQDASYYVYLAGFVLVATAATAGVAKWSHISAPILLVCAGILLASIPGVPSVEVAPDVILLLFLPPILYFAAFRMSWHAFRANLRAIFSLATGGVLVTTGAVAIAAHFAMGMPWPAAFLLGAIVSPPDVVAPLAIVRRMSIPHKLTDVLEGEGLVNDATALVLFGFALSATTVGAFSLAAAAETFAAVVVGETAYGLAVGWLMLSLRTAARDPRIEISLSLVTPYLAFWGPHHVGGSGVLATVVAGLYVGLKGVEKIRSNTRLQALFVWDFQNYLIEGALFLITGLQASVVAVGLKQQEIRTIALNSVLICLILIIARFAWVYPATYLPRLLWPKLRRRSPAPPWTDAFFVSFTGVRGAVSLAAALSLPVAIGSERNVILVLTFAVIFVTLVLQGATLPWVVTWLGLAKQGMLEAEHEDRKEIAARAETGRAALHALETSRDGQRLPPDVRRPMLDHHRNRVRRLEGRRDGDATAMHTSRQVEELELALIQTERARLNELVREGAIPDHIRRRIERDLDLEEQRSRSKYNLFD